MRYRLELRSRTLDGQSYNIYRMARVVATRAHLQPTARVDNVLVNHHIITIVQSMYGRPAVCIRACILMDIISSESLRQLTVEPDAARLRNVVRYGDSSAVRIASVRGRTTCPTSGH